MTQHRHDPPERLLTIDNVAQICRVSERTVRRWIKDGDLPSALLGGQRRIRPRDLDSFIEDRLEQ